MVTVELVQADVDPEVDVARIVLQETDGNQRLLTIFIGNGELQAIQLAMQQYEPPRPMTHDLLHNVTTQLGATLERVVITELIDRTFYAELHLQLVGQAHVVSARPSDAVALALRFGCRIFVSEEVLDEAAALPPAALADEMVEQFRDFIDHVNPDDFGS